MYLGDSNRQAQPSRENLEWHPKTNTSKSKAWSEMTSGERKREREEEKRSMKIKCRERIGSKYR